MSFLSCKKYTSKDLAGIYINQNFEYTPFLPEIPYSSDTLILREDYTFFSEYFGKGEYKIIKDGYTTHIVLNHEYEFGTAGINLCLKRDKHGQAKIMLFELEDHYYKKIQ